MSAKIRTKPAAAAGMLLAAALGAQTVRADPVRDFYKDNTINLYIGFPAGGGYDIYGRLVAKYFGQHVPGNPKIVPQNMVGAGGIRAANYLYSAAPKDGTAIGIIPDRAERGAARHAGRRLRVEKLQLDRPHHLEHQRPGLLAHLEDHLDRRSPAA